MSPVEKGLLGLTCSPRKPCGVLPWKKKRPRIRADLSWPWAPAHHIWTCCTRGWRIHPLCLATFTVIENTPPSVTPLGGRWERMPGSLSQKRATTQRVASERQKLSRLTHSILSPHEEHEMRDDCGLAESLHKPRPQGQPLPSRSSQFWMEGRQEKATSIRDDKRAWKEAGTAALFPCEEGGQGSLPGGKVSWPLGWKLARPTWGKGEVLVRQAGAWDTLL